VSEEQPLSFMDSLEVSSGSINRPTLGIIYSFAGAGKTGLCLHAENPFYVALENGVDWIPEPAQKFTKTVNGKRVTILPRTIDQFWDMLKWLMKSENTAKLPHPIKTVVIDSLGFFEALNEIDVIQKHPSTGGKEPKPVTCIADLNYDGRVFAMDNWRKLLTVCKMLRDKCGYNVILITHAHRVNTTAENGDSYKIIDMELMSYGNCNVPALIKKDADWCAYLSSEVNTIKRGEGQRLKTLANGTTLSESVLHVRSTSLFYAKVRSSNEKSIPDAYFFNYENRESVAKKFFADMNS
jgi:hypothetical protein